MYCGKRERNEKGIVKKNLDRIYNSNNRVYGQILVPRQIIQICWLFGCICSHCVHHVVSKQSGKSKVKTIKSPRMTSYYLLIQSFALCSIRHHCAVTAISNYGSPIWTPFQRVRVAYGVENGTTRTSDSFLKRILCALPNFYITLPIEISSPYSYSTSIQTTGLSCTV